MSYRIYYADGTAFDCLPPPQRRFGVVAVADTDSKHGRHILAGKDYYYRRSGRWYDADLVGLIDQITSHLDEIEIVLVGRMTSRENYNAIIKRARSEAGLPAYTAKYPDEAGPR